MDTAFYAGLNTEITGDAAHAELTGTVDSAAACGGPWSPDLQHGGPPSALLIRLAERLAGHVGRGDLVSARIAAEFFAPVPVAQLAVSARVVRLARSAVLVSAALAAGGRTCFQARVWLMAEQATQYPGEPVLEVPEVPGPDECPPFDMDGFPYADHLEWRVVSGSARRPGPASVWVRPRVPVLAGEPLSTLQRLALIADSASGVSALLDWDDWSFANVDLDLHLVRQSSDEWVLMQATSVLGVGLGLARSTLSDRTGVLGGGMQTLLVRSRRD